MRYSRALFYTSSSLNSTTHVFVLELVSRANMDCKLFTFPEYHLLVGFALIVDVVLNQHFNLAHHVLTRTYH